MTIPIYINILMRRSIGAKNREEIKREEERKGRREENKMKAQIDREQTGEQRTKGIKITVKGRILGRNRKRKKVIQLGRLDLQDRLSRIEVGEGTISTKFGKLGVKIHRGKERKIGREEERIVKLSEERKVNEKNKNEEKSDTKNGRAE